MPYLDSDWNKSTCTERMSTMLSKYGLVAGGMGAVSFGLRFVPHPAAQLAASSIQGGLLTVGPAVGYAANTYLKECNAAEPAKAH